MMRGWNIVLLAVGTLVGCAESDPTGSKTSDTTFSAMIDGVPFVGQSTRLSGIAGPSGTFEVTAFDSSRAKPVSMTLVLYNIPKPGIYPLGMGPTTVGGFVDLKIGDVLYHQLPTGNGGVIVLKHVSATRLAGTFSMSFSVPYDYGPPGASVSVTDATFDVPIVAYGSVVVPNYKGSLIVGTVGSKTWRAAGVQSRVDESGVFVLSGSNYDYVVGFAVPKTVGTFEFGTPALRGLTVRSQQFDWGVNPTGSVTVTSVTEARVSGFINAITQPAPGSENAGNLKILLSFDVALPQP